MSLQYTPYSRLLTVSLYNISITSQSWTVSTCLKNRVRRLLYPLHLYSTCTPLACKELSSYGSLRILTGNPIPIIIVSPSVISSPLVHWGRKSLLVMSWYCIISVIASCDCSWPAVSPFPISVTGLSTLGCSVCVSSSSFRSKLTGFIGSRLSISTPSFSGLSSYS